MFENYTQVLNDDITLTETNQYNRSKYVYMYFF